MKKKLKIRKANSKIEQIRGKKMDQKGAMYIVLSQYSHLTTQYSS
jgi:hypothetical protein